MLGLSAPRLMGLFALSVATVPAQANSICWLEYSIVDAKPLAADLTTDLKELRDSELIRDSRMTTWVYVDGSPDSGTEIEGLLNEDGSAAPAEYEGVRYLNWDHDKQAYVVKAVLGEKNSDDPQQLTDYLTMGLADCINKGSNQFMVVMSAHGSAFGFGGDEIHARNRRRLVQSNQNIVGAIQQALNNVEGAPDRLDLLGFDACLQAGVESLKDFQNITHYYLASEATEPGHGWNYEKLTPQESTLDIAKQSIDLFANTKQGNFPLWLFHMTPKTLAVFDMDKVDHFYEAWEALFDAMGQIITPMNDTKFFSIVSRSRLNTASYMGIFDSPQSNPVDVYVTMDIGDFIKVFWDECNPPEGSELDTLLANVQNAQQDMTIDFQAGPETNPASTGLAISWPSRREYLTYTAFHDARIFNKSSGYAQDEVPKFHEFLIRFVQYDEAQEVVGDGESICTCPKILAINGEIMLNRSVEETPDKGEIAIQARIADVVDSVLIEFGIEVTHIVLADDYQGTQNYQAPSGRRRMLDKLESALQHHVMGFRPTKDRIATTRKLLHSNGQTQVKTTRRGRRRIQETETISELGTAEAEDYVIVFGGWIEPHFGCDGFTASWDKNFFALANKTTGDPFDFLYVYREGNGANSVPVFYFEASTTNAAKAEIQAKVEKAELTFEEAEEDYGGLLGYLQFSSEAFKEASEGKETLGFDSLSLYASNPSEGILGAPSEVQRSQGGFIVPILYVESQVDGYQVDYMLGGFSHTLIDWGETAEYDLVAASAKRTTAFLEGNETVIDLTAYDYVSEDVDPDQQFNYFVLTYGEDGEIVQIEEAAGSSMGFGGLVLAGLVLVFVWW